MLLSFVSYIFLLICVIFRWIIQCLTISNILFFNFCEQKFVQHGPITIAIDCNGLSLLIFEKKMVQLWVWTKICIKQWLVWGFLCPKCDNFACLHTCQDQNEIHLKKWWEDKTNYLSNQTCGKYYYSRNKH